MKAENLGEFLVVRLCLSQALVSHFAKTIFEPLSLGTYTSAILLAGGWTKIMHTYPVANKSG